MKPVVFDDYLRAIHRLALMPADTAATLIVGSMARGWSNEGSDIDVIIVCSDVRGIPPSARRRKFPLTPSNVSLETTYFGGRRVDMEYWLGSQIDQVISK